jgi:hypothetical protein
MTFAGLGYLPRKRKEDPMIVLGVILLIVGLLISIPVLWYIGIALIVIGLVLNFTGRLHAPYGGGRYWY